MLSGRGIDGELKSKFGEWSEKFWKLDSLSEKIRAIYFANGVGGDGGEKLDELKGNGEEKLIKETSDKVEKFFGYCVGGGKAGGDSCKNSLGKTVVLVGDDPDIASSLTWEKLKEQNWSDQTSLVRSGHSYEGLFDKRLWKGGTPVTGSKFNPLKITQMLNLGGGRVKALQTLCPLVPSSRRQVSQTGFGLLCTSYWNNSDENEEVSLSRFLTGENAKRYFESNVWKQYYSGDRILALVVLLDLWSNDLTSVDFSSAKRVLSARKHGFVLTALMSEDGDVVSLNDEARGDRMGSISYRKGGEWTVQLCSADDSCDNRDNGLSVVIGSSRLCVSKLVCIDRAEVKSRYRALKTHWGRIRTTNKAGALWDTVFGSDREADHLERLLVALLVACFSDVGTVTLTVLEPSEKGDLIFTHLK